MIYYVDTQGREEKSWKKEQENIRRESLKTVLQSLQEEITPNTRDMLSKYAKPPRHTRWFGVRLSSEQRLVQPVDESEPPPDTERQPPWWQRWFGG